MPGFAVEVPYVVALVELDEGPRMLANLVDATPEQARIGMPVRAVFEPRGEGLVVPQFRPA
jgi:uncharacterized OB-fold protein